MKLRKDYYRNKPPRVFCEFTEKEWADIHEIYWQACISYNDCFGESEEMDKTILMLRKWGKRFGWHCCC